MNHIQCTRHAGLDAVRGIAILLVVASHFAPLSLLLSEYLALSGVILFFLLSGLLMERTISHDPSPFNFFIRRAARILPMYWVSIVLAQFLTGPFDALTILSNAAFAADLTHSPLMLGVYWTLYIEVRFYAIVPVLRFAGEATMKAAPYAAIAANSIIFARSGSASHLLLFMSYCLAGMQISFWQRARIGGFALTCCMLAVCASAVVFTPEHRFVGLIPICGTIAIFLATIIRAKRNPLSLIGRVSYSWYLLHTVLGYSLAQMPIRYATLLAIAATLATSTLAFYLIEFAGHSGCEDAFRST